MTIAWHGAHSDANMQGLMVSAAIASHRATMEPGWKAGAQKAILDRIGRARRSGDVHYLLIPIRTGSQTPLSWLRGCGAAPSVYWRGRSERTELAGYRSAYEARLKGPETPRMAAALAEEVLHRCVSLDNERPSLGERLFCGFAFDPLVHQDSFWADFPDAWIFLPEFLCIRQDDVSRWLLTVPIQGTTTPEQVWESVESAQRWLGTVLDEARPVAIPSFQALTCPDTMASWNSRVRELTRRMEDGHLHKVVLARQFDWRSDTAPDIWSVVERLGAASPGSYVFGFRPGTGPAFVGASPERLFRLNDRSLETECVAGTIGRGSDSDSDESLAQILLASRKDNLEHYYVQEDILHALTELCERMDAGASPQILKLPTLQHLVTTAHGQLREGQTLADVLLRLHPTPAVGGAPRDVALPVIREMESATRGWYAGPVGWIGADGAEFAVAIRSAMITEAGATVFAGAGIVRGSEPEKEWRETENKARAFVSAIESHRP